MKDRRRGPPPHTLVVRIFGGGNYTPSPVCPCVSNFGEGDPGPFPDLTTSKPEDGGGAAKLYFAN